MKMYKVLIFLALVFSGWFLFLLYFGRTVDEVEFELHENYVRSVAKLSKIKKVILLYNHVNYEQYPILDGYCLDKSAIRRQESCPNSCLYTDDKSVLEYANAVVISARNLKDQKHLSDLPPFRKFKQRWILYSMESPIHPQQDRSTGAVKENRLNLRDFVKTFNWTMSYRHDADIRVPYGRVLNKIPAHSESYDKNLALASSQKPKLIAWISSDCFLERSGSSFLVAQLQKFIRVDIYGKCGQLQCSQSPSSGCSELKWCFKEIALNYKFYLALENSLCEDYVTEGFFYALEFGMVPVVYGKANYSDLAIPGSFVNAMKFEKVRDLAVYLKHLDSHPNEYGAFFHWRKKFFVTTTFHMDIAWCSLCSKLWEVDDYDSWSSNSSITTTTPHPRSSDKQLSISPRKIVGLDELQKFSAAASLASRICEGPPNFVVNTNRTFSFPGEKKKKGLFTFSTSKNEL